MTTETTQPAAVSATERQMQDGEQLEPAAFVKGEGAFTAFRDYDDPTYNEDEDEDYNDDDEETDHTEDEDDAEDHAEEEEVTEAEAQELLKDSPQPNSRRVLRGGKVIPDQQNVQEITSKVKDMFDTSMASATVDPR